MKFGKILRKLREEKEISQVQLAKNLNITSQSLSQYELNKRMPDVEMINKLADYFNVSIDYLLGRTDIKKPIDNLVKEDLTESSDDRESINIEDLSPESQEDLKKYIELLKLKDMQKRNSENCDELSSFE